MKDIFVSRFGNYRENFPDMNVNLWDWLTIPNYYTQIVDQIRKSDDIQLIKKLKEELPAITPSGTFFKREAKSMVRHSGLICLDIDGKDNQDFPDMESLKKDLFHNENILYCGLSVSGKGLFCLIPIAHPEKHKEHFFALERDFLECGICLDKSCRDVCRLRGYSFDWNPHINFAALTYQDTIVRGLTDRLWEPYSIDYSTTLFKFQKTQESKKSTESIKDCLLKPTEYFGSVNLKSKSDRVRDLVDRIESSRFDITKSYKDWVSICSVLTNLFREDGRNLFHQVSQFYPNYRFEENDKLYSDMLNGGYRGKSDTLFEIAAKYGIR